MKGRDGAKIKRRDTLVWAYNWDGIRLFPVAIETLLQTEHKKLIVSVSKFGHEGEKQYKLYGPGENGKLF